jgi:hypothetical protein
VSAVGPNPSETAVRRPRPHSVSSRVCGLARSEDRNVLEDRQGPLRNPRIRHQIGAHNLVRPAFETRLLHGLLLHA